MTDTECVELLALGLLEGAPTASYLVERRGEVQLLWRISEGEPEDAALVPAASWLWGG